MPRVGSQRFRSLPQVKEVTTLPVSAGKWGTQGERSSKGLDAMWVTKRLAKIASKRKNEAKPSVCSPMTPNTF